MTPLQNLRPHEHAFREAATVGLYLAIVLLSVLVGFGGEGDQTEEVTVIWATAVGLGLAHLFAFRLTAVAAHRGTFVAEDLWAFLGIVVALVATAGLASLPYAIWGDTLDASTVSTVLLMGVIGFAGFASSRDAGASNLHSLVYTAAVLLGAAIVVGIKSSLAH